MSLTSTFVLVPGAWHGGWAWRPVARRLRAAGQKAVVVTMPGLGDDDDPRGLGLEDAVAHVVHEVERRDLTDVVLVGHSWGSFPATGAAHRLSGRVVKIVYFSAPVPTPRASQNDLLDPQTGEYVQTLIDASSDGTFALPFELFQQLLMPDEPERAQRIVFDQLVPQPGGYMLDPLDVAQATPAEVAVAYVLAREDRALPRPGHEFAAQLGVEPIMVPGSHEALLTHPDEVTEALRAA